MPKCYNTECVNWSCKLENPTVDNNCSIRTDSEKCPKYKGEPSMEKSCLNKLCFYHIIGKSDTNDVCRKFLISEQKQCPDSYFEPIQEEKTMEKIQISEKQAREFYYYTMNAQDEDEALSTLKKMGIIKLSNLEKFQKAKLEFEESIAKNMSTKELQNILDLCDAAIKELQEVKK